MLEVVDGAPDVERFLELEALASAPYAKFVHTDEVEARSVARRLFEEGVAEFAPPNGWSLVDADGETIAIVAGPLSAADLSRARLRSARVVMKLVGEDTVERMKLAGRTLWKLEPGDAYLSRIAVVPTRRRLGIARHALTLFIERAKGRAARRVVLEVDAAESNAVSFYRSAGFTDVGTYSAEDATTERRLVYMHMVLAL